MSRLRGASIAFRADASPAIGSGHLMRCLALADALAEAGARCRFVARRQPGDLLDLVAQRGHEALPLALPAPSDAAPPTSLDDAGAAKPPQAAGPGHRWQADAEATLQALGPAGSDWLVVDHYGLDARWEGALRPRCGRLMAIDDLADRAHACDLLLDQNLGRKADDYRGRVPDAAQQLTGAAYALLAPAYREVRAAALQRRRLATPAHLLVFLGGGNPGGITQRVLQALRGAALPPGWRVSIVMGASAPGAEAVRAAAAALPWPAEVRRGLSVEAMAALTAEANLALGAAGTSAWERCCVGLPTIVLVVADNQRHGAQALQAAGAALSLEPPARDADLATALDAALVRLLQPSALAAMSQAAAALIDGQGVARVVAAMEACGG